MLIAMNHRASNVRPSSHASTSHVTDHPTRPLCLLDLTSAMTRNAAKDTCKNWKLK
jgi:hypothetical protein